MAELEKKSIKTKSSLEVANPDKIHVERYEQSSYFNYLSPEVLGIIFRYLNGKDLSKAAMQCRMWRDAANYEESLRGPDCFYIYYSATLGLYNIYRITQSPIKPHVAIVCIGSLYEDEFNIRDSICKLLPTNCKTIILHTNFCILNNNIYHRIFDGMRSDFKIVCALLPPIRNGQLRMVIVEESEICTDIYREYLQMIDFVSTASKQNQEFSICLMLFCDYDDDTDLRNQMIDIAKSRLDNNERVSFCGCVVTNVQIKSAIPLHPLCAALFITGSIRTWSVVLNEDERKFAEKKLQKFKDQVQLQKHTIAFVFVSRYYIYHYRINNDFPTKIEAVDVFKNLFSNVPLIGCGSIFEFGRDTANYEEIFRPKSDRFEGRLIMFMILTYN